MTSPWPRDTQKIAIMESGRIVEAGRGDTVLARPDTDHARELVAHRHWHTAPRDATYAAS